MAITRANVEAILVKRAGALMSKVGFAVTVVGSNADLNDPIGWGVRQAGGTVSDYSSVTDTDVATVATADYDKMLDFAELRLLENIVGNLDDVDVTLGPRSEKLSQLLKTLQERKEEQEKKLETTYGYNVSSLSGGVITETFAEHEGE